MPDQIISETLLFLQERRCQLEGARAAAVTQLNRIEGAIADYDYLCQQLETAQAAAAAVATPQE